VPSAIRDLRRPGKPPSDADPGSIQGADPHAAGFRDVGEANGQSGRRTQTAIERFRVNNGLPAGGIDRQFLEALGIERGGDTG